MFHCSAAKGPRVGIGWHLEIHAFVIQLPALRAAQPLFMTPVTTRMMVGSAPRTTSTIGNSADPKSSTSRGFASSEPLFFAAVCRICFGHVEFALVTTRCAHCSRDIVAAETSLANLIRRPEIGNGRAICIARPAGMTSVTVPTGPARQRRVGRLLPGAQRLAARIWNRGRPNALG